jgi:hypothetical protein
MIVGLFKNIRRKRRTKETPKEKKSHKSSGNASFSSIDTAFSWESSIIGSESIVGSESISGSASSIKEALENCSETPTNTTCMNGNGINANPLPCHVSRFESVLDYPFPLWGEMTSLYTSLIPEWTVEQRRRMIHHLIHFVELKVNLDNNDDDDNMLLPSLVVVKAWRVLAMQPTLYSRVTHAIQQFHGVTKQMILPQDATESSIMTRLQRTQALFQVYFREKMPDTEDEIVPHWMFPPPQKLVYIGEVLDAMSTDDEDDLCSYYSDSSSSLSCSSLEDETSDELLGLGLI